MTRNRSALGPMMLAAATAALIIGLMDRLLGWISLAAVLAAIWMLFYVLDLLPSLHSRFVAWLEEQYSRTSPRLNLPKRHALDSYELMSDTAFGLIYSEDLPEDESPAAVQPASRVRTRARVEVENTRELIAKLGC